MISCDQLFKTYAVNGKATVALKGVSLHVPRGSIFGIIGSSGAGKSSLLRCVNLLERPDSGRIVVGEQELTSLPPSQLRAARRQIGMVFQHFNLLANRTVYGNIALPLELRGWSQAEIRKAVPPLLALTGMESWQHHRPQQLSGGQKQRVAIARALVDKPQVLLCDEATSALDPQTTEQILELLRGINRQLGLTILLITHELDVIKRLCQQVALMAEGQILETQEVVDFFTCPQSPLAKRFLQSSLKLELPPFIHQELEPHAAVNHSHPIVKLTVRGEALSQPLLSHAIKTLGLDINLLLWHWELIGTTPVGLLFAKLQGSAAQTSACIAFFQSHHIRVEVLGYVS